MKKTLSVALTGALLLFSCKQKEEIKTIDVALDVAETKVAAPQKKMRGLPEGTDFILAYVIPTSSRQWFVKITMPRTELGVIKPVLEKLQASLVIDENAVDVVTVDLGEGWNMKREQGFIHSSITNEKFKARITISEAQGSLLSNVNRWNGQLGNSSVTESQLPTISSKIKVNGRFAILVFLTKSTDQPVQPAVSNDARFIVAAIINVDNRQWFIKSFGYQSETREVVAGLDSLITTLKFEGENKDQLKWDAAPGWEIKKESGFLYASMSKANVKTRITLSSAQGSLLANVNRWNGQLGNGPITETDLVNLTTEREIGGYPATLVFLRGPQPQQKHEPGHEGHNHPPGQHGHAHGHSHGETKTESKASGPISCKLPDGWKDLGARGMRALNLTAGDIPVTAIKLPSGAKGVRPNVDRWCGQVGLANLSDEELKAQLKVVTVDGLKGDYIVLKGKTKSIIVAMVERGDSIWFFKGIGTSDKVLAQKANFEAFVASIKFNEEID